MTTVRDRVLDEAERIARGKAAKRDALARFLRAARRAGVVVPQVAIDSLAAEVDAAAYWRARADGHELVEARFLADVARKRTRRLLS